MVSFCGLKSDAICAVGLYFCAEPNGLARSLFLWDDQPSVTFALKPPRKAKSKAKRRSHTALCQVLIHQKQNKRHKSQPIWVKIFSLSPRKRPTKREKVHGFQENRIKLEETFFTPFPLLSLCESVSYDKVIVSLTRKRPGKRNRERERKNRVTET